MLLESTSVKNNITWYFHILNLCRPKVVFVLTIADLDMSIVLNTVQNDAYIVSMIWVNADISRTSDVVKRVLHVVIGQKFEHGYGYSGTPNHLVFGRNVNVGRFKFRIINHKVKGFLRSTRLFQKIRIKIKHCFNIVMKLEFLQNRRFQMLLVRVNNCGLRNEYTPILGSTTQRRDKKSADERIVWYFYFTE